MENAKVSYSEQTVRRSQVSNQIDQLENLLQSQNELISVLNGALEGVLIPESDAAVPSSPEDVLVPVANRLRYLTRAAENNNNRLSDLLNRIEL